MKDAKGLGQTLISVDWKQDLIPAVEYFWELNEHEAKNVDLAIEKYVFGRRIKWNVADPEFLKKLHKDMFSSVWKWAGKYRTIDTSIGVSYFRVPVETQKACDDLKFWIKKKIYDPIEIAVRFHHRLVSVHLFVNGNGRHARIIADIIMRQFNLEPLKWGSDMHISEGITIRKQYIDAIKKADKKNFFPLIKFALGS